MININLSYLHSCIDEIIGILEKNQINSIESIERKVGKKEYFSLYDFVNFSRRPSNYSTYSLTISYNIQNKGIPLEIRINPFLGYSYIFVKANRLLSGFNKIGIDQLGNRVQYKLIDTIETSRIFEELRDITLK